jgi:hypothetical protein
MIGNAVPVNLAHFLANSIKAQLLQNEVKHQIKNSNKEAVAV